MQEAQDTQNNPYDSSQDKERLKALEEELEQNSRSLENDFSSFLAENTDEGLENLFFEDKKAFYDEILKKQNTFLSEKIGSKQEEINTLKKEIKDKDAYAEIESAKQSFLKENPEANLEAMTEFYNEELGNKYKKALDELEPQDFFNTLYQIYTQRNTGLAKEEELPKQLQANGADVENVGLNDDDLPMNRI